MLLPDLGKQSWKELPCSFSFLCNARALTPIVRETDCNPISHVPNDWQSATRTRSTEFDLEQGAASMSPAMLTRTSQNSGSASLIGALSVALSKISSFRSARKYNGALNNLLCSAMFFGEGC
jgi:hypothetical protein